MPFVDHFGGHAAQYQRFRPRYPDALFATLAHAAPARDLAWDVGAGSGQAASGLARCIDRVIAVDGAVGQLARMPAEAAVTPVAALAEAPPLAGGRVSLIAVAQALHWLDLDAFYPAVRRVARPGACLAAWCYTPPRISPPIDAVIDAYHDRVVGPFWPSRRRHVLTAYRHLPFPFARRPTPELAIEATWTCDHLLGYLGTWSAARRYLATRGTDPRDEIADDLRRAWGDAEQRTVRWPLHLLLGRVDTGGNRARP